MKIVHTGDWHLGKILSDYSLLEDQRFFISRFVQDMETIRPHVIVIAGDIYDRSVPSAEAVELLNTALRHLVQRLHIPVIITAGNHDSGSRLAFAGDLLKKSGLYLIGAPALSPEPIVLKDEYGEVSFYPLPYLDLYDIKSMLPDKTMKSDKEAFQLYCEALCEQVDFSKRNVLIAHGFFTLTGSLTEQDGTKVGTAESLSLAPLSKFDYLALGHLHGEKSAGLSHARYSGSPLKYSIDEAGQEKGYLLITLKEKGDPLTVEKKQFKPLRDLRVMEGHFADFLSPDDPDHPSLSDYVFLSLTDKEPILDAATQLKAVYPNLLGIRFPNYESQFSARNGEERVRQSSPFELFEEFVAASTGETLSEKQKQTVRRIFKRLGGDGI